jgi:deoxyribonuclease-4
MSIAGGVQNALVLARKHGFDTTALFVRNQRQWRAPALTEEAVALFRDTRAQTRISPVVAHGSYLVNLAGSGAVREKSIDAMADEYLRCIRLGIEYLVFHPGSCAGADEGCELIAAGLEEVVAGARGTGVPPVGSSMARFPTADPSVSSSRQPCEETHGRDAHATTNHSPYGRAIHGQDAHATESGTMILLETSAGQGSSLCCGFEQLAAILARLNDASRFGVCLDTCHVFAAGYDIRTPEAYEWTMAEFGRIVGLGALRAIHLNDSVKELGSRVDRHAHIGKGKIGLAGFANFVNDPRLAHLPMLLETPKEIAPDGREWDDVNAESIRSLVKGA